MRCRLFYVLYIEELWKNVLLFMQWKFCNINETMATKYIKNVRERLTEKKVP